MGAKQIRLAQRGQHREKWFRTTHFLAKIFKGVWQRVTYRITQRPQSKRMQKRPHLMLHPHRAVLQVAVIKAQSRIDYNFVQAFFDCRLRLTQKIVLHRRNHILQIKIFRLPHIASLHITNNDPGRMLCRQGKDFLRVFHPG